MKRLTQLRKAQNGLHEKKKVAAYCRVSSNAERPQHSLAVQINYFTRLINSNPEWEMAGIYSDFGISGTGIKKRAQFLEMIQDCNDGKIDLILTKSIQRFARNTLDLLKIIRDLKNKGIEVYFEKENISSMSGEGELMLSILASIAQEESISTSKNVRWSVEKSFKEGIPYTHKDFLGYRWNGDKYEIVEDQAKTVRYIFDSILQQKTYAEIAKDLNRFGWLGRNQKEWSPEVVKKTASNIHYTGVLLLGQYYRQDPISHKLVKNNGERDMYYVEQDHEPIIAKETYEAVQEEMKRRKDMGPKWKSSFYPFTRKIICGYCGAPYVRGSNGHYPFWGCKTVRQEGRSSCPSVNLDEESLIADCRDALNLEYFDSDFFRSEVDRIVVEDENRLNFYFRNGYSKVILFHKIDHRKFPGKKLLENSIKQEGIHATGN